MKNRNTSQSPELAGGDGFTYEGHVVAFYLTALLAEASAPGCDGTVVNVASQQRDFGYPLDDVIIKWIDASIELEQLACRSNATSRLALLKAIKTLEILFVTALLATKMLVLMMI